MNRKIRKTFSRMRRFVLNEPHVKASANDPASSSSSSSSSSTTSSSSKNRSIRINLPSELGGGRTVASIAPTSTLRDLTVQVIGLAQATNQRLLDAKDWGLSTPLDEDDHVPDAEDDEAALESRKAALAAQPRVFLHPDTAIALVLAQQGAGIALDLLRVRPIKDKIAKLKQMPGALDPHMLAPPENSQSRRSNSGVQVFSTSAADVELHVNGNASSAMIAIEDEVEARNQRVFFLSVAKGDRRCTRDPETSPSPFDPPKAGSLSPAQLHLRHNLLSQLKTVKSPKAPLPAAFVPLLAPPPLKDLNNLAAIAAPSAAATTSSPAKAAASKAEIKAFKERERERAAEIALIESILSSLSARGIGHVKRKHSEKKKKVAEEEEEDAVQEAEFLQRTAWCGGEHEVPILFSSTRPPAQGKKKFDMTENCTVLTNLRCLQIEEGVIRHELKIGPGSEHHISIPKRKAITAITPVAASPTAAASSPSAAASPTSPSMPLFAARFRVHTIREQATTFDSDQSCEEEEMDDLRTENDDEADEAPPSGRSRKASATRYFSFQLPSEEACSFLHAYIRYMQSHTSLTQNVFSILAQSGASSALSLAPLSIGAGWTSLLRSFIGPLIFAQTRVPLYTHAIKQVLAHVQQINLKNLTIYSLRLTHFHLPSPKLSDNGEEPEDDFIPSLSLRSWQPHPSHRFYFDIDWNCPSFLVRVQIEGKKFMSFKLELEMKGIRVRGSVILHSSPYAAEELSISFVQLPQLSFGVGSKVVVGNVKLPFQQSIEKLITTQIQNALSFQMTSRVVYPEFVSLVFPQSSVSVLLNRYWAIARFPFRFDGRDDEEMMGLSLVIGTQAEHALRETLEQMRKRREQLEDYMSRDIYGESRTEDWQEKEALRIRERDKQRQMDDEQENGESAASSLHKSRANGVATSVTVSSSASTSRKPKSNSKDTLASVNGTSTPPAEVKQQHSRRNLSMAVMNADDEEDDEESRIVVAPVRSKSKKSKQARES